MDVNNMVVGIVSDTHGLLRLEAIEELRESDLIVHAGDIGKPELIEQLRGIAPTFVVRGNVDTEDWAADLPATNIVKAGHLLFYVVHDIADLDADPVAAGFSAVIYGHSHLPSVESRNGVLFLNPGSAGPRRFTLPVTLGRIRITDGELHPEIIVLEP